MVIKTIFWISVFIVFYTYIGYGILIWLINIIKSAFRTNAVLTQSENFEPLVALVIPAYNEEDCVEDKIKNSLLLNYPEDKVRIYFVTDGSYDNTPRIVSKYPQLILLHKEQREGKAAAMNRAMLVVQEPFVVFSDANTMLNENAIKELVKLFSNAKVGAVAGEKKILQSSESKAASVGEGVYWKYESFLKKQDADFYSVVGAAGELFSIRKELYEPIASGVIIEDFVLSLGIAKKGFLVKYAPDAFAIETASASIKEEQKRKIRISAGGFQAMFILRDLLNIFRYGVLSFQYISHRVLRWSVTPVCFFMLLPLNAVLALRQMGIIYVVFLAGQVVFYLLALAGWVFSNQGIRLKLLYIPYYFLFMNLSVFLGLRRILLEKQSFLWEKAAREKIP
jgi:biofilm PGA synthesis N-glycosyltransferase PgaC